MIALKGKLVDSRRLVKYEELPVDGSPAKLPLGDRPKGYIIYSADGFMAALLSPTVETSKADPNTYLGPYSVDEARRVVHQRADLALVAGRAGKAQDREIRMEGERLILSTESPATPSGRGANAVITWQRVDA